MLRLNIKLINNEEEKSFAATTAREVYNSHAGTNIRNDIIPEKY
jgi:hypothetical protein